MKLIDLFNRLDENALTKFLSKSTIDVFKQIDSDSIRPHNLAQLIVEHMDKYIILNTPQLRKILIRRMDDSELTEFAHHLNIDITSNVLYELLKKKFTKKMVLKSLEFFDEKYEKDEYIVYKDYEEIEPDRYLYPYQLKINRELQTALNKHPHKALLHIPTGAGKTFVAIRTIVTHFLHNPSSLVIWLAHNEELCEQAIQEFQQNWKIAGDQKINTYRFFRSSKLDLRSIKSGFVSAGLAKMIIKAKTDNTFLSDIAQHTSLVIIDEAHMAIANKFRKVIEELSRNTGVKLLGLSATPGRKSNKNDPENKELANFFNNNKIDLKYKNENPVEFLTRTGFLAKTNFRFLPNNTKKLSKNDIKLIVEDLDIPELVLKKISEDVMRNLLIINEIERLYKTHDKILVFSPTVEHAKNLSMILASRDINSGFIYSKTSSQQRKSILSKYKEPNHKMVLCNFGILTTGFDAPKTSALVIARPTKSDVLYAQMVGRGTRGPKVGGTDQCDISVVVDDDLRELVAIDDIFKQWEDSWHE